MSRDWEALFSMWAKPPSQSEQERIDNAIRAVRKAVNSSEKLKSREIRVFVQGSYRNRVNVRRESDVDIGVMCHEVFLFHYPPGKESADFGHSDGNYSYRRFKDELEEALVNYFGRRSVTRGNKAFDVKENSYRVEADVVPVFEFRYYYPSGSCICGTALLPDKGGRIENYPERLLESWPRIDLHYENGVLKNRSTSLRYKGVVRILKTLRNEMEANGSIGAKPIPGFLIECLVWNVPDSEFRGDKWDRTVQSVLLHLWSATKDENTCQEWCEVNDVKYLFRSFQPWSLRQAHEFIDEAWSYVGVR